MNLLILKIFQVSLLTESGGTKDDLRLPTDDNLLSQVSDDPRDPYFVKYMISR